MRAVASGPAGVVFCVAGLLLLDNAAVSDTMRAQKEPRNAQSALSDTRGVSELRTWFNGEHGHPRLILLLSPT